MKIHEAVLGIIEDTNNAGIKLLKEVDRKTYCPVINYNGVEIVMTMPSPLDLGWPLGFDRFVRNKYGLWRDDFELSEELAAIGVVHPDDASTILLWLAHCVVFSRPISDLRIYIKQHQAYWNVINSDQNTKTFIVGKRDYA